MALRRTYKTLAVASLSLAAIAAAAAPQVAALNAAPVRDQGSVIAPEMFKAAASTNPLGMAGTTVVAVGDIACAPGKPVTATQCQQAATARQARAYKPSKVFTLGDTQYEDNTYRQFMGSYDKSWGGSLKTITKPILGNHEYRDKGAAGYMRYFKDQQPGGAGYYAFNVGSWRVYNLNSNCTKVDCAREARWLDADMTRNAKKCTIMNMHHPLYSSGYEHGDSPQGKPFWKVGLKHRAEIVLAGHDHNYERFHRMNADGKVTTAGIRSFVVGTGGKNLYHSRGIRKGSAVFSNRRAGVLAMKLGNGQYGWQFKAIDGRMVDQGVGTCR